MEIPHVRSVTNRHRVTIGVDRPRGPVGHIDLRQPAGHHGALASDQTRSLFRRMVELWFTAFHR